MHANITTKNSNMGSSSSNPSVPRLSWHALIGMLPVLLIQPTKDAVVFGNTLGCITHTQLCPAAVLPSLLITVHMLLEAGWGSDGIQNLRLNYISAEQPQEHSVQPPTALNRARREKDAPS
jgi:hypothetical protein